MKELKELKEFLSRSSTAVHDMNPTDRRLLAKILEDFEHRLTQLEKDTDPHRQMAE